MIKYFLIIVAISSSLFSYVQKKTYDIMSYNVPSGWAEQQGTGFISYSKVEGNNWGQIAVYQHRSSEGDIQKDFDKDWKDVVGAASRGVSGPEKTAPQSAEGWTGISGAGVWQYNGVNVTSILTTCTNNKVCVSVLCNATAQNSLKDYQALIGSLNLIAPNDPQPSVATAVTNNNTNTTTNPSVINTNPSPITNSSSIVGLWCDYNLETSGYINGMAQYTAGYFRKEYLFNADGSYTFRLKDWLVSMKDILYVYEIGTYSVSGNQLIINPKQGIGQWWAKQGGKTNEWGGLLKVSDYKPENVTYAFEMKYYSGSNDYSLILKSNQPTQREGGNSTQQFEFHYNKRASDKTLIDNPPGFNINK